MLKFRNSKKISKETGFRNVNFTEALGALIPLVIITNNEDMIRQRKDENATDFHYFIFLRLTLFYLMRIKELQEGDHSRKMVLYNKTGANFRLASWPTTTCSSFNIPLYGRTVMLTTFYGIA